MNEVYKDVMLKSIGAFCGTAATLLIEKGIPAVISVIAKHAKKKDEEETEEIIDGTAVVVETEES